MTLKGSTFINSNALLKGKVNYNDDVSSENHPEGTGYDS